MTDLSEIESLHDLEAERCTIGSLMLAEGDLGTFDLTAAPLQTQSFFQADYGIIFDTILRMRKSDKPVDFITLRAELTRAKLFEEVGGQEALANIINSVPSYIHGPYYASIVREKYMLREIVRVASDALRRTHTATKHDRAAEIARSLCNDLASIACTGDAEKIHKLVDVVAEIMAEDQSVVRRFLTGLMDLDDCIGGIAKGRFTQVGGRPGMGKSLVCKQIVLNIARQGVPCGIVSIEETREKIGQNYLANLSGVENNRIVYGRMEPEEANAVVSILPEVNNLPIFIADSPVKMSEVESAVTALVMKHGCEVVVVDYLQLITPDHESENENREITKISKSLKGCFKRLNVAGLVPVQLNRGNEAQGVREPTLRDLRGSGSLEQDGDCIILLHRDDYYRKGDAGYTPNHQIRVIVAKNKDGQTGKIPLFFDPKTQSVSDWGNRDRGDYTPDAPATTEGMFQ